MHPTQMIADRQTNAAVTLAAGRPAATPPAKPALKTRQIMTELQARIARGIRLAKPELKAVPKPKAADNGLTLAQTHFARSLKLPGRR